jgi:hypothetical protein
MYKAGKTRANTKRPPPLGGSAGAHGVAGGSKLGGGRTKADKSNSWEQEVSHFLPSFELN